MQNYISIDGTRVPGSAERVFEIYHAVKQCIKHLKQNPTETEVFSVMLESEDGSPSIFATLLRPDSNLQLYIYDTGESPERIKHVQEEHTEFLDKWLSTLQ